MASFNLAGNGFNEGVNVTGDKTLTAADSGLVQNLTASATVTLPAIAAGTSNMTVLVRVGKTGLTATISPNSADKIVGNGQSAVDDKDLIFTNQPAGTYVQLVAANEATTDSAWVVQRIVNTATRQA